MHKLYIHLPINDFIIIQRIQATLSNRSLIFSTLRNEITFLYICWSVNRRFGVVVVLTPHGNPFEVRPPSPIRLCAD